MRLKIWGCRGSIPTPGPTTVRYGGNTTCYQLTLNDGRIVMFDAGTGIRECGYELMGLAKGKPLDIIMLFTHTHWDHINGFPFFIPIYIKGNRLRMYGPFNLQDSERSFQKVMGVQMSPDYFPVRADELASTITYNDMKEGQFDIDGVTIRTRFMNHPIQTLGYRVEIEGKAFVFTGDHEPYYNFLYADEKPPEGMDAETYAVERESVERIVAFRNNQIVEFCRHADVLLADAQYTPEEYETKRNWGHSSWRDVCKLAIDAQVKRAILTHHEPLHSDDQIDKIQDDARRYLKERGAAIDLSFAVEKSVIDL
ncbi:MAG: MBL fold metallo-hydrolase [Planctomycetes bacterium]|nr:MBL fold metallo-hydrolase [Planctomycetota bacterium]